MSWILPKKKSVFTNQQKLEHYKTKPLQTFIPEEEIFSNF